MLTGILWMRPWRIVQPAHTLAWGVLAVIGLHSLLEYPLWYGPFQIATLLSLCMLWSGQTRMPARRTHTLQVLGGAGLVLIALISADYWRMRQIYLPAAERSVVWRHDPWGHAQNTLFFERSVTFAKLTTTEVTADNAAWMLDTSQAMLHYSPEPRVIERLIDSARLLGRDDLVALHQQRLRQAFKTSGQ